MPAFDTFFGNMTMTQQREEMPLDVLFVGGGPASLAGAIRLMQLAGEKGIELEVGIIEKADSLGSHSLSGAILDPVALKELIPDYRDRGCPVEEYTCRDVFYFLTESRRFPVSITPAYLHNQGCHIISLSRFVRWLGEIAEEMGVMIFPGFAGTEVLYDDAGQRVTGIRTGDKGVDRNGALKGNFEPGVDVTASVTVFGEGPRGSLIREVGKTLGIFSGKMPQTYETAIKEVIELPGDSPFAAGDTTVVHTFGYPLGLDTKGGGFLYRMAENRVAIGLVVGLDYADPMFEPYEAFLRFKKHPAIAEMIRNGKVLQQGAKTLCAGGYYSMPKLAVDGALFVGDSASMLNAQRLKGIHTAMKSGMLAAEAIIEAVEKEDFTEKGLASYPEAVEQSWIHKELRCARNFSQAMGKRFPANFLHIGLQYITDGKGLIDPLHTRPDSVTLEKVKPGRPAVEKVKDLDGTLFVDKLTGVYLSGTQHEEDQPCHLVVHDTHLCVTRCHETFRMPCTRFCPGAVYEMDEDEKGRRRLKLNPSNCLHCKTCEIKDPFGNITWVCPEGGGGPKWSIL